MLMLILIILTPKGCEGVSRGGARGACPQSSTEWIFYGKKLCWDVGPALFSKVTLFSLPEVFCGP